MQSNIFYLAKNCLKQEGMRIFIKKSLKYFLFIKLEFLYIKLGYYPNDIKNKIKYGLSAPIYAERIWINPLSCKKVIMSGRSSSGEAIFLDGRVSGKVLDNWPPNSTDSIISVNDLLKFKACIDHWTNGIPWDDTGIYEYMEDLIKVHEGIDDCKNIVDIKNRYKKLDNIFNQIKLEGRLKTMKEMNPKNYREFGGPVIHIGPDGELFYGAGGTHRFAIAFILNFKLPAMIGCVHKNAIPLLKDLRKNNK